MPSTPSRATSSTKRFFALSIAEETEWAYGEVEKDALGDIRAQTLDSGRLKVEHGNLPHISAGIDVEADIRSELWELKQKHPDYFDDVDGVGVSTVGIVDQKTLCLVYVPRKNWHKKDSRHVIDFEALFLKRYEGQLLFPKNVPKSLRKRIAVRNDAAARCLTEARHGTPANDGEPGTLLHLIAGEGINGAIFYKGGLLDTLHNSEMGHNPARLHESDANFDPRFSGCPSHTHCFEALASAARLRLEWWQTHANWSPEHPGWARTAFYLAQMAMIGATTFSPGLISFGGLLFVGDFGLELLEDIRREFNKLNNGYLPYYRSENAVRALIGRATFIEDAKIRAAITMACEAVYRTAEYTEDNTIRLFPQREK